MFALLIFMAMLRNLNCSVRRKFSKHRQQTKICQDMFTNVILVLTMIIIPDANSFSSYRPTGQQYLQNEDLNAASSYGCECCTGAYSSKQYSSSFFSPDGGYIMTTALVLGGIGWLAVAAAAFGALFLVLEERLMAGGMGRKIGKYNIQKGK